MMKKRFMAFLVAGTVITGACGTYAAYVDTVKVNNKISTGIVDVNLDEFQREANGKLVAYENDKVVLPGDKVSKSPVSPTKENHVIYVQNSPLMENRSF